MVPSGFDQADTVLDAPEGMAPDECESLNVWRGSDQEGRPIVISCWKPTREELDEINRTGRVWLFIWGHTMPPAGVTGFFPFEQ